MPLLDHDTVQLAHGAGGRLSADLIDKLILPRFSSAELDRLEDQAVLDLPPGRVAFSTDTFVVSPIFFPGGDIGDLAINGTVNDVAMSGAEVHRPDAWASCWRRGCPWPTSTASSAPWKRRPRPPACASSPATPRSSDGAAATGSSSTPRAWASCPPGVDLVVRAPRRRATRSCCRAPWPTTAWPCMTVREGLSFQSSVTSDTAALNGLVARPAAGLPRVRRPCATPPAAARPPP